MKWMETADEETTEKQQHIWEKEQSNATGLCVKNLFLNSNESLQLTQW